MTTAHAKVHITFEMVEHLVAQLREAARVTGWKSLLRDVEALQEVIDRQFPNDENWATA